MTEPFPVHKLPLEIQIEILKIRRKDNLVYYSLEDRQFYHLSSDPNQVFDPPMKISERIDQPLPIPTINHVYSEAACVQPIPMLLKDAILLITMYDMDLAVMSNFSTQVYPAEARSWAKEKIGSHVKKISIGTQGGGLNLDALPYVTNLSTLKLHSRRGLGRRIEDTEAPQHALFHCCLDDPDRNNNYNEILRLRGKTEADLNRVIDNMESDARVLSLWIANQKKLRSLKLQFLNIVPRAWTSLTMLSTVRLRRCTAHLFWSYVHLPSLRSLSIQEPTSLMVGGARTIPTKTLGEKGLTYSGILEPLALRNNRLDPIPIPFPARTTCKITSLTLCAFRVENNDLTPLLAPFTVLTHLCLETTRIRILPEIQTLTTLVLRDICLEMAYMYENVFRCICWLRNLESLTLDNVVSLQEPRELDELPKLRVNTPLRPGDPDDPNDIDKCVQRVGINKNVRKLTLGIHDNHAREEIRNYKVMLQRMFPNVSTLTFTMQPFFIECETSFPVKIRVLDCCKRTSEIINYPGQKFGDNNPLRPICRGWDLETVEIHLKDIKQPTPFSFTVPISNKTDRMNMATIATRMLHNFPGVSNLLISLNCISKNLDRYGEKSTLFDNGTEPKSTIRVTSYSEINMKTFSDLVFDSNKSAKEFFTNTFAVSLKQERRRPKRFALAVLDWSFHGGVKKWSTTYKHMLGRSYHRAPIFSSIVGVKAVLRYLSEEQVTQAMLAVQKLDKHDTWESHDEPEEAENVEAEDTEDVVHFTDYEDDFLEEFFSRYGLS